MHVNVSEWCLDQYCTDAYQSDRSLAPAADLFPRVYRGGSWDDHPHDLRSARRFASADSLMSSVPMLPQSIWHNTDGQFLGFRIIRPLEVPSTREMDRFWNCGDAFKDGYYNDMIRA